MKRAALWTVVAGVAVLFLVGAPRWLGSPDDDPTSAAVEADDAPTTGATGEGRVLALGERADLPEGAAARLNSIMHDVEIDPGLPQPEDGLRIDRLDVEVCAGAEPLFAEASLWMGLGVDNAIHEAHLGIHGLVTLTMPAGMCQRGSVDLAVPDGVELQTVLLADEERTTVAQWSVDGQAVDQEPLSAEVRAARTADLGTATALASGGTATLTQVLREPTPETPIAGDPVTRVQILGELCAEQGPMLLTPRSWFLQLTDNRLVKPDRDTQASEPEGATGGSPPPSPGELEPGQCESAAASFTVPASAEVAAVLYAFAGTEVEGRWRTD